MWCERLIRDGSIFQLTVDLISFSLDLMRAAPRTGREPGAWAAVQGHERSIRPV